MAGTSFQIDIAAQMTGGDMAAGQLRQLEEKLQGMGTSAASFDAAIDQVRAQLSAAQSASASTAAELAAGESKYRQLEVAADRAAKAVEKAAASGRDTSELQAKAAAAAAAVTSEAEALDKLKASAKAAAAEEEKLSGALKNLESAASKAKPPNMGEAAKKAAGPFGEMAERAKAFVTLLGPYGAAAAAVVVGFLAMGAAVAYAVGKLAILAVTLNKAAMEKINKITEQAKKNFAKLFEGVHVDAFVKAFDKIAGLLDENSSTAKALKTLISTILNPLFDAITPMTPYVVAFFRGMVLGALYAAIGVVMLRNAIRDMIPPSVIAWVSKLAAKVDWMKTAMWTGVAVVGALALAAILLTAAFVALVVVGIVLCAVALFALVAPIAVVVAGFLMMLLVFSLPLIAIIALVAALAYLGYKLYELAAGGSEAAKGLIDGLVGGIQSGAGAFMDAVRNLAKGGIDALKSALGIASPSKVFAFAGKMTAVGYAEGVEDESDTAAQAVTKMATGPAAAVMEQKAPGGAAGAKGGKGAGTTFQITIHAPSGDGRDIATAVEAVLTRIFEGDVMMLGASEVPA